MIYFVLVAVFVCSNSKNSKIIMKIIKMARITYWGKRETKICEGP